MLTKKRKCIKYGVSTYLVVEHCCSEAILNLKLSRKRMFTPELHLVATEEVLSLFWGPEFIQVPARTQGAEGVGSTHSSSAIGRLGIVYCSKAFILLFISSEVGGPGFL